ncbi:putative DsbA family dithiol-disulfide isomerase [Texcoconibacillus texcoconensis]|uniref:Putative DsbA family dithiol-disulfide isomerase n=1 Tax=Texcoconibacillus texcoconensis TaxID=1095777 RepID=A0A840QUU3_9BACI|nr:putative DsbA family dithiol-disulfide isomerase [Texcoconibacillus texcoconensis]
MEYRSFELDPAMEWDVVYNIYEKLANKYGMSVEQAKANIKNMVQMAQGAGLDFQMDTLVLTNTFDAHRLTMLAKQKGLAHEMEERLFKAHYTESKHIGDHQTLIQLAEEVGLDPSRVEELLNSDLMSDQVRADEQEATQLGIKSVPYFLIDREYAITGAQSTEAFVQLLQKVIDGDGKDTNESTRLI